MIGHDCYQRLIDGILSQAPSTERDALPPDTMADDMTNDATMGSGGVPLPRQPDAQGQAALMLVESMLHALVDAGTFATDDALAIIAVAREVKEELGKTAHERPALIAESIGILDQIAISFATDQR